MKVLRAEAMGMCFGVRDAIRVAEQHPNPSQVAIHGELVHNEVVGRRLRARGLLVVGGKNSNNTRRLAAIAREAGARVTHVTGPEELRPGDFVGVEAIGLTAGTSTLPETIDAVELALSRFAYPLEPVARPEGGSAALG